MAQGPRLYLEIAAEDIEMIVHRAEKRIERFALHIGLEKGLRERGIKAAQARVVYYLELDAVQRERDRILDLFIAGKLRFVCVLAHGGIWIVCKIANGGKVDRLAAIIGGHG